MSTEYSFISYGLDDEIYQTFFDHSPDDPETDFKAEITINRVMLRVIGGAGSPCKWKEIDIDIDAGGSERLIELAFEDIRGRHDAHEASREI